MIRIGREIQCLPYAEFFDNKSYWSARLDWIRVSCFVTQSDCRFDLFPPVKFALTFLGFLSSLSYEYPKCSSAKSNPTAIIWSRQGVGHLFSFLVSLDKYVWKFTLFVLLTVLFAQLMKYFIAIVKSVLVCLSNLPKISKIALKKIIEHRKLNTGRLHF